MSHRRDMKRAAAGGYPGDEAAKTAVAAIATVARVRSLLRTWEQFGTGDDNEDTVIAELRAALDPTGGNR